MRIRRESQKGNSGGQIEALLLCSAHTRLCREKDRNTQGWTTLRASQQQKPRTDTDLLSKGLMHWLHKVEGHIKDRGTRVVLCSLVQVSPFTVHTTNLASSRLPRTRSTRWTKLPYLLLLHQCKRKKLEGRPHACPRVGQEFTFTDSSPTGEFWELGFLFLEFPLGCFPLFLFLSWDSSFPC